MLQEPAQIRRLDRGTATVIRQDPTGPYYNHPCCENGRHVSCYVPAEQVAEFKAARADCQRFQHLLQQNIQRPELNQFYDF